MLLAENSIASNFTEKGDIGYYALYSVLLDFRRFKQIKTRQEYKPRKKRRKSVKEGMKHDQLEA